MFWSLTLREFFGLAHRSEIQQEREDRRFALIATILANANRNPKKRARAFRLDDFMPKKAGRVARQTPEQQRAVLAAAVLTSNGTRRGS